MTEFEAATIAFQQASLEIGRAGLEISRATLWVGFAQAGVALLVGAVQCGLIYAGLRYMRRAADHRDQQHQETMRALEAQTATQQAQTVAQQARHEETMRALEALILRTAPPTS